ncbi:hypothetical protein [Cryptosporangium aurantiacum]|uniref:Lipid droplet-associated protein n=1 Tax=Cryptosporangium aurantiacum TaxID=134849 RepID=A0A1M7NR53_9ACTN|nr:hypothetical protein [Cryptosporangium aurantiacum]SHN06569.1 hypothetical protein SAMN05443668_102806 [Cryptosporangium aurantiacum]
MLTDVARRVADPAEKLLTKTFRFAGWVVGRTAAPLFSLVRTAGRPAVHTLAKVSPAAAETLWSLLPGHRPEAAKPTQPATPPTPTPVRPAHVAKVPSAEGAPTPAAAHAEAAALLAEVSPDAAKSLTANDELPVKNWDGLTIAAIRQRTRSLSDQDILTLLAYERAHASRPAVILNLENRLAKLHRVNGATATQS